MIFGRPAVMKFKCLCVFMIMASSVCASESPVETPLKILALGDSTTAGTPGFHSPAEWPPKGAGNPQSQYAYWIEQAHPRWTVFNHGIAGERTDQILARSEEALGQTRPDRVIVLAGVNDLYQGRSVDAICANLDRIYSLAEKSGAKVLICTVLPYNLAGVTVRENMRDLNEWIREQSRKRGFMLCDTFALLEDPQRPGQLIDSPDGVHPGVKGYRMMGEAMVKELEKGIR